ncbi:MAG TPA: sensor histidine kinase N-terminal domain-containing protein [Ramlibacter sp.]|nr:sensor histidine kinase N-terminal domain-containing protein [Ramlibacter sp.]
MLIGRDPASAKPSLRSRLARHVLLPLALTWGLGSIVVLMVAQHFAAQAFDRALLDDAWAMAAHVREEGSRVTLHLTPQEINTVLFDQTESVYFAVFGPGGTLLAGQAGLRPAQILPGESYTFSEMPFEGKLLRGVTLRRDEPVDFVVVMAMTTASRTQLLRELVAYSAPVQVLLLLALAWWLSRIIERDLHPVVQLQQAVDQRDAGDLAPLPPSLTQGATTQDLQRLGDAVNSLLSRLQESLSAQRHFAGNVAHELRTPLAGIRARAGYALAQDDPALWRTELQGIAQAEERASRLVDQLLALARADESNTGLVLEPIALDELVREVVLRFLPRADALGVDLGAEGLEEPVEVRGDKALIEGILNNLLDNALRYGSTSTPHVTVALHREGGAVILSVTDNGPGLGIAEARQLTQRWTQGAQGQKLGQGAGLGLAIVRRYAELLHAQLSLERGAQGEGLCAKLRFQLSQADATSNLEAARATS